MTSTSTKLVLTEHDFDQQSFHDSIVHGIAFLTEAYELVFDIDYIHKWLAPCDGDAGYSLIVAPATLVFENVHDVRFDLAIHDKLIVLNLIRDSPSVPRNAQYIEKKTQWQWTFECTSGTISFKSVGYTMYYREQPDLHKETNNAPGRKREVEFTRGLKSA